MQISYSTLDISSKEFFKSLESENLNYRLHAHYSMEIVLVKSGRMCVTMNEQEYFLEANTGLLIPSYHPHSFTTPEGETSSVVVLMFTPELVQDFYLFLCSHDFASRQFSVNKEEMSLLLRFLPCRTGYEKKALLYGFLSFFTRNNPSEPKEMNYSEQTFHQILAYLIENAQRRINLERISTLFGIHPVTICKMFKKNLSLSFGEVLGNIRITRATALLKNSERTISEIAYECGFGSLRNFNRVFQKYIGCTPREYREKAEV